VRLASLENFRPMDFCWHECTCRSTTIQMECIVALL